MKYTVEQAEFIKANCKGVTSDLLAELFNARFGTTVKPSQMKNFRANRGLVCGVDCRYKKGQKPVNAGTKGVMKANATSFKPGQRPHNWRTVGSERTSVDGYVEIKVAEPNKWRMKHAVVYEKRYGAIPKGSTVIFGDGDKTNFALENLVLVTRAQLVVMNRKCLTGKSADVTRAGATLASLISGVYDRAKHEKTK
jgi:hypothetical protein